MPISFFNTRLLVPVVRFIEAFTKTVAPLNGAADFAMSKYPLAEMLVPFGMV